MIDKVERGNIHSMSSRGEWDNAASLKCCALVVKRTSLTVDVPIDYVGFEINHGYAVGYGIADKGRFRGLRYLGDASRIPEP